MLKSSIRNHLFITVTLALVLLMIALSGTLFAQVAPPVGQSQHIEAGQTPDGLSAAKWDSIQAQIAAGKYQAYAAEAGGYGSSNPAHGWQIAYGADGLTTLTPRNLEAAPWQWGLQLTGYGYGRLSRFETPAWLEANGPNLTYQWDASLSEWWHNTAAGLEQGFTVAQRPEAGDGRPLVLEMAVRSSLTPVQRGQTIAYVDKSGATVLTYDKLHVTDANGRGIPAHLSFTPVAEGRGKGTIRIVVEDGHATYPLTIDPLVSLPQGL